MRSVVNEDKTTGEIRNKVYTYCNFTMKTRISLINFLYSNEECNVCILVSWQVKYSDNHNYLLKK